MKNLKKQDHPSNKYGHLAERPKEIKPKGWKFIFKRVKKGIELDHIPIVAAGVAFFFFFSLFPAIAALISIYGLIMDPQQVQQQVSELAFLLPNQASQFLMDTLQNIAKKPGETLGWGFVLSVLISLWSANLATRALFKGINIVYNEKNKRNFFQEIGLSLLFTLGAILVGIICLSLIVGFPAVSNPLNLPGYINTLIKWGRWLILAFIIILSIAIIYRFAPSRRGPKFRWVTWGSVIATVLWLIVSWAFSFFVDNFGNFDQIFGPVAAIIILMLWFFLTSFLILIGAELNAEMEHQTKKDTTIGADSPMGEREAYHADHVAGEENE
ncbi:MAG: YihY/virulence factor BrkB family protein [bacterium]